MIIIMYPAGTFGSTIEYCLRQFSNEFTSVSGRALDDGSMHSFKKEFHPTSAKQFSEIYNRPYKIVTPIYPNYDCLSPEETIALYKSYLPADQKVLLIYFASVKMAQDNQLFCYYKVKYSFLEIVMKDKAQNWNKDYESYKDMQLFELREALSFFIDQQNFNCTIHPNNYKNWMCIIPDEILYDFKNTLIRIMDYFGLTIDDSVGIDKFCNEWLEKQQYILDEIRTIDSIIDTVSSQPDSQPTFHWNTLSIVGEAIVQSRLRQLGIEIACQDINQFPTNSLELKKLFI